MRLSDSYLRQFLPTWAQDVGFLCDGMDGLLHDFNERAISLSAPLTLEACEALTDEDLQRYYEEYGLAKYYPDVSHERRAWLLWQQAMRWRWLGTPRAVEILCEYIMDLTPVTLKITDNLAYGPDGTLRNPELLHVFDAELSVQAADLPEYVLSRVYDNIIRFKNDRTKLRGFSFVFDLTGGGLDAEVAYTDGGNFETFFELNAFNNAPQPYKATGYFTWNHSQIQINAGAQRDVNPPLTAYTEGFSYRPTRYYSGVADTTGASADGLLLVNNNGHLALYNNKGTAIRIQRLDFEYEPCTVIYPNEDKTVGQCAPNGGGDLSLYDNDGTRWSIKAYPQEAWRIHRAYTSASDVVGFETSDMFLQRFSSSTTLRSMNQTSTITWQRAEAVRVWNPVSYTRTYERVGDTIVYTFTLDVDDPSQAVHVYGYCRGMEAGGTYHYYKVEGDFVCVNKQFSITVSNTSNTTTPSESLIITKI